MSKQLYEIADLEWRIKPNRGPYVYHVATSPAGKFMVIEHCYAIELWIPNAEAAIKWHTVEAAQQAANAHNRELIMAGLKPVTASATKPPAPESEVNQPQTQERPL